MNPKTLLDLFAIAAISFALNGGYAHRLLAQESSASPESSFSSPGQSDSHVDKPQVGKSQVGKFRFEPSATREYQIEQARKDSQARKELLRYYEERGVNFAANFRRHGIAPLSGVETSVLCPTVPNLVILTQFAA